MAKSKKATAASNDLVLGPEDMTQDDAIAASKERIARENEALNKARGGGAATSGTSAAAPTGAEGATTTAGGDATTTTTSAATTTP